jgi:hypothetical protein
MIFVNPYTGEVYEGEFPATVELPEAEEGDNGLIAMVLATYDDGDVGYADAVVRYMFLQGYAALEEDDLSDEELAALGLERDEVDDVAFDEDEEGEDEDEEEDEEDEDSQTRPPAKGGPGSGNWGHLGRRGNRGGSRPGGGLARIGTDRAASHNRRVEVSFSYRNRRADEMIAEGANPPGNRMPRAGNWHPTTPKPPKLPGQGGLPTTPRPGTGTNRPPTPPTTPTAPPKPTTPKPPATPKPPKPPVAPKPPTPPPAPPPPPKRPGQDAPGEFDDHFKKFGKSGYKRDGQEIADIVGAKIDPNDVNGSYMAVIRGAQASTSQMKGVVSQDDNLAVIMEAQGFHSKPKVVDKDGMDEIIRDGGIEVYRGVRGGSLQGTVDMVQSYATGDHFVGQGIYGNGTYTAEDYSFAKGYANQYANGVMRIALHKDAKVIDYPAAKAATDALSRSKAKKTVADRAVVADNVGRWAALNGYDAIRVNVQAENYGGVGHFFVILNRGAVAVQNPKDGDVADPGYRPAVTNKYVPQNTIPNPKPPLPKATS